MRPSGFWPLPAFPPMRRRSIGQAAAIAAQAGGRSRPACRRARPAGARRSAIARALFKQLLDPKQPEPVQAAAARALGQVKGPEVATFLIERWRAMTPAVRGEAADDMFLDPARPRLLLNAIERDAVQPWTLAFRHKRQLVMSRDTEIREKARKLLEAKAGEREKVLKRYEAALQMNGDAGRGRQVFERVCSKCHRLKEIGHEVGPDLATVRNRPPQFILPDIMMPNKSIAQGYESYVVETKSSGMIEGVMGPQIAHHHYHPA